MATSVPADRTPGAGRTDAPPRRLIVNADDFGLSHAVNRGIMEAHERGIVTSASLMVRAPAGADAAAYARRSSRLAVGLHLDLCEWVYVEGAWRLSYRVVALDDADAVRAEVRRQYEMFFGLMDRSPTHIDSHQHVHRDEPVRSAVLSLAAEHRLPVRHFAPGIQYCGSFYGQSGKGEPWPEAITPAALIDVLASLPAGVSELACHPGSDAQLNSVYRLERLAEVQALCDPRVRQAIFEQTIELRSFADLGSPMNPPALL
jgi:predicted glycoside hydrolase/deacetylase ChbG (UPF0249 family)